MDADCLIKLTKGGAKEDVSTCVEITIPEAVEVEAVDQGKTGSYPDSLEIERNIRAGKIRVEAACETEEVRLIAETLRLRGGEVKVYTMFHGGEFLAIASDDQKFMRKMEEIDVPCITPTALIIYTWRRGAIDGERASKLLQRIHAYVSEEEYALSKLMIEKGGEPL